MLNTLAEIDAAKRLSDTVNLHLVAQLDLMDAVGKWVAARLEDGSSDGALYDSKNDAMRFQSDPKLCCYLKITPDGISVKDAVHFLRINRHPLIDTTQPEELINPYLYPRYSNLSSFDKRAVARQIEGFNGKNA